MDAKGKKIQSVEKAMQLLDCFWRNRRPFTLAELAAETGWAKSTIHALLSSMIPNAMIQHGADGRYRLGYHAFELGSVVEATWDVKPVAATYMRQITDRTGESLYLGMLAGDAVLLVESTESYHNFPLTEALGSRMPLYACSLGKVLLSYMPQAQREDYLRGCTFQRFTPYTVQDVKRLRQELQPIREQGYALEFGELQMGLKSVAAPIFDHTGSCCCAISAVTIARGGVESESFKKLQQVVLHAAQSISFELQNPTNHLRGDAAQNL